MPLSILERQGTAKKMFYNFSQGVISGLRAFPVELLFIFLLIASIIHKMQTAVVVFIIMYFLERIGIKEIIINLYKKHEAGDAPQDKQNA